jgi:homoaconitase/3-isopropylmalate dehydratase large subunit
MKTDTAKDTLLAFVDEIGDRGHSGKSSEYFAMSAAIFPASVQQRVKECIANIKAAFGINLKTPLH